MDVSLDGKVALVTGAGPNIGSGIALALSRYGARVACNDLDSSAAKAAVRRIERNGGVAMALSGDVSVEADVLANIGAVLQAWDRIDIVINNAAWLHACGLLEEDLASFNRAITIAVNGNFLFTKHGAVAMIERGIRGSIVSILSSNAWQGAPGFIAYATHKGGLANFVRAARTAWFEAERRLGESAASGVDAEVVSPFPPLLNYLLPAPFGRDLARWVNEYIAGLCAAAPDRIYGLGTVPLQDPDLAAGELASVAGLGLAGVEIASNVGGLSLADERFGGFFAEAERLGTAIFVHAMPVPSDRLPAPATATFGVGVEGSLAAAALITGGVAEKYPGLRLAFSHAAGGFPLMLPRAQWFWGRTWNEEPPGPGGPGPEAAPWAAPTGPAELARRFWYDSLVFDHRAIRYLLDMIGPERLLVGSDFPAMPRESPAGRTLSGMGLPDATLDDIRWHNCFRFLA